MLSVDTEVALKVLSEEVWAHLWHSLNASCLPLSPPVHSAFSDYVNSEISVIITWYLA